MCSVIIQPGLQNGVKLYRYMKQEHVRAFRKQGILRLSRLFYYHKVEELGHDIGDLYEGTSTVNLDIDYFEKTETNSPPSATSILVGEMGTGAVVENCKVINSTVSNKNLFCLSMSLKRSKELLSEFSADEYFEIKRPDKFFKSISRSIKTLESAFLVKCEYTGRIKNYNLDHHDDDWLKYAYLKEPRYSNQEEVRGVWAIPNISEDHVFVKCFEATRYCKFF